MALAPRPNFNNVDDQESGLTIIRNIQDTIDLKE